MALAPHKEVATIDVKDCQNGTAEVLICQGQLEFSTRLDADQVDDLQAALEDVGRSLGEFHRAQERDEYGDMQRLRGQ